MFWKCKGINGIPIFKCESKIPYVCRVATKYKIYVSQIVKYVCVIFYFKYTKSQTNLV